MPMWSRRRILLDCGLPQIQDGIAIAVMTSTMLAKNLECSRFETDYRPFFELLRLQRC